MLSASTKNINFLQRTRLHFAPPGWQREDNFGLETGFSLDWKHERWTKQRPTSALDNTLISYYTLMLLNDKKKLEFLLITCVHYLTIHRNMDINDLRSWTVKEAIICVLLSPLKIGRYISVCLVKKVLPAQILCQHVASDCIMLLNSLGAYQALWCCTIYGKDSNSHEMWCFCTFQKY